MKAIVGLGNPGVHYAENRHNIGFMVLDRLAAKWKAKDWFNRYQARTSRVEVAGGRVILAKPQTFMNNSGTSVKSIVAAYGIDPTDVLLVYDDLDLAVGQLRLRRKGSAGGHKGVLSVIARLGVEDCHRLRLGIGNPPPGVTVVDYVLGNFSQKEWQIMQDVLDIAVSAIDIWVQDGIEAAMAKFNGTFIGNSGTHA